MTATPSTRTTTSPTSKKGKQPARTHTHAEIRRLWSKLQARQVPAPCSIDASTYEAAFRRSSARVKISNHKSVIRVGRGSLLMRFALLTAARQDGTTAPEYVSECARSHVHTWRLRCRSSIPALTRQSASRYWAPKMALGEARTGKGGAGQGDDRRPSSVAASRPLRPSLPAATGPRGLPCSLYFLKSNNEK